MIDWLMKRPASTVLGGCLALFLLYELSVVFFAYTGDAYVNSDTVTLSAEIEGPIARLDVHENQVVAKGAPLFTIDPTPYQLAVDESTAAFANAEATLALSRDRLTASQADLASAQASETAARETYNRVSSLARSEFASGQAIDDATRDLAIATARAAAAGADVDVARQTIAVNAASVQQAQATLNRARYQLSKTAVIAPDAGRVAPFTARVGDYLQVGNQVLTVVTDNRRRVVANLSERHLARLRPGQRVWLTLGSQPWVVHAGRVTSVAPGVARSPTAPLTLPYVDPTTDWVRLPRRFPVDIALETWPADLGFYLGADARVLVIF
ncbi:Multidrug efflux system membrane fusion protein [Hyphomicrobiales bacterium]|nr:Multidrug efflux system membrane fusion protein [Hyphomicrobiales bacterium]CAH1670613.1 Multidrug efflux system membrane fusion protein [Hyphomicrobiales bacterium]